jgi:hypothetical protein
MQAMVLLMHHAWLVVAYNAPRDRLKAVKTACTSLMFREQLKHRFHHRHPVKPFPAAAACVAVQCLLNSACHHTENVAGRLSV